MRIVVSGGGSGGHITPILAVTHHLISRGNNIDYIGTGSRQEQAWFAGSDIKLHTISTGKYRRYPNRRWKLGWFDIKTLWFNLVDFFRFLLGILQSLWLLYRVRPDRVFVKGGYVGLPVGIAAWILRKPLIIHESDATPGLTNRVLARLSPHRLSGFLLPGFKALGNPVRENLLQPTNPEKSRFGIKSSKPVVLVVGGSLGSEYLNQTTLELVERCDEFEVIHIYGKSGFIEDNQYGHYHPYQFLTDDMAQALQLADVVVARGGANTLAELAALGKPSIIVPHPNLSDDHQAKNTTAWQDALVVVPQPECTAGRLQKEISRIVNDTKYRSRLKQAISSHGNPKAAADIAEYIINLGKKADDA